MVGRAPLNPMQRALAIESRGPLEESAPRADRAERAEKKDRR